jgi:hypothetical protein
MSFRRQARRERVNVLRSRRIPNINFLALRAEVELVAPQEPVQIVEFAPARAARLKAQRASSGSFLH